MLCLWKPESASGVPDEGSEAHLIPVPKPEPSKEGASPANEVTAQYNEISRLLRRGKSDPTAFPGQYHVRVDSWQSTETDSKDTLTISLVATINGSKIPVFVALPSIRTDALAGQVNHSQKILVHSPALGTWIEFQRSSLLSYIEGLRSATKAQAEAGQEAVTAPMPCKVLSVLKQDGQEVKSGETVMVIESMKMEMSITVSASGKLRMAWKMGDSVEEGKTLCSVV